MRQSLMDLLSVSTLSHIFRMSAAALCSGRALLGWQDYSPTYLEFHWCMWFSVVLVLVAAQKAWIAAMDHSTGRVSVTAHMDQNSTTASPG